MLRNMSTSLLEHQQIKTTLTRAKELRKEVEKMITLGKRGDLTARRQALGFVKSKEAMKNLFGEFAERYKDRNGGYTRIIPMARRLGDNAPQALVILVDGPKDPFANETPKKGKAKPKKTILEEVSQDVKGKQAKAQKADADQAQAAEVDAGAADKPSAE